MCILLYYWANKMMMVIIAKTLTSLQLSVSDMLTRVNFPTLSLSQTFATCIVTVHSATSLQPLYSLLKGKGSP